MEIEEIRAALPIREYLVLAHEAIITGEMPIYSFDPSNPRIWTRTVEKDKLSTNQRLDLLAKIVDKAMPDYKGLDVEPAEAAIDAETVDSSTDMRSLDARQLQGIIDAAKALIPEVSPPDAHPPTAVGHAAHPGAADLGRNPADPLAVFYRDPARPGPPGEDEPPASQP